MDFPILRSLDQLAGTPLEGEDLTRVAACLTATRPARPPIPPKRGMPTPTWSWRATVSTPPP